MSVIISGLQTTWKILWRTILFFLIWGFLLSIFFVPFGSGFTQLYNTYPLQAKLLGDVLSAITILSATWGATLFIDRRPFQTIGFNFNSVFKDLLAGVVVGFIWLAASLGILYLSGWASLTTPVGFSWTILAVASLSMLLNVLTQELLLCGFIFQTIRDKSNLIIALLISAALFAVYHAPAFHGEWLPAVNVFAAGLIFCLAYIITGNLWLPIAIHFTWDVLLGPVLGLTESGKTDLGGGWKMFTLNGPSLYTGGKFGLEGGLIVTMTTAAIIMAVCYFKRTKIRELLLTAG